MKGLYLLSTEHLEECLWFRDDEDFKVGMNYVAIEAAIRSEVAVLAFILMSNHVHFVLRGSQSDVTVFANKFKQRYSIYYQRKYGVREFLRKNGLDVKYIPADDEGIERAIAYVQMNCVAAGICSHPSQYPWGTGNSFFGVENKVAMRLKDLSARARKRLLHSEEDMLPLSWPVGEYSHILPSAYVDIKGVEYMYRSPQRMNYFLTSSSKARKRLEIAEDNLPAFRDQTVLAAMPDLCQSLFRKNSFETLLPEERVELARQIRFRFSADATQIARVCGLSYADAARLLDGQ